MTWPKSRLATVPCVTRTRGLVRSRSCHQSGSWAAQLVWAEHRCIDTFELESGYSKLSWLREWAWKCGIAKVGEGSYAPKTFSTIAMR